MARKFINTNRIHHSSLSSLDKFALKITKFVGSMGFFLIVFAWTILWCGYNLLATQLPTLHLKPFDPFPAFVAYLLISNVIQILLMPLIMVGQNVDSKHTEIRADSDHEVVTHMSEQLEALRQSDAKQEEIVQAILNKLNHLYPDPSTIE